MRLQKHSANYLQLSFIILQHQVAFHESIGIGYYIRLLEKFFEFRSLFLFINFSCISLIYYKYFIYNFMSILIQQYNMKLNWISRTQCQQTAIMRCSPLKICLYSNMYRLRTTIRVKAFKETHTHAIPYRHRQMANSKYRSCSISPFSW